jgi:hypothetical protein
VSPTLQAELLDTYPVAVLLRREGDEWVMDFGAHADLTPEEGLHAAFLLIVKAMGERGMIVPDPPHPSEAAGYL